MDRPAVLRATHETAVSRNTTALISKYELSTFVIYDKPNSVLPTRLGMIARKDQNSWFHRIYKADMLLGKASVLRKVDSSIANNRNMWLGVS